MTIEFSLINGLALGIQYAEEERTWVIDFFVFCILIELDD